MSDPYGPRDEPTRRIPVDPEARHTRQAGEVGGPGDSWRDPYAPRGEPPRDTTHVTRQPRRRRGRDVGMWLFGAVIGFVIAFVVVALGTGDRGDDAATAERVEALEAELDDRDGRIAELEAQLEEAEAAAGERAEDVQAQRQALDDRAGALDQRAGALDEREAALDRREAELAERERALEEQPADGEEPADGTDDGLPGIDDETVDTFVDRVLDQLRDLFGG